MLVVVFVGSNLVFQPGIPSQDVWQIIFNHISIQYVRLKKKIGPWENVKEYVCISVHEHLVTD